MRLNFNVDAILEKIVAVIVISSGAIIIGAIIEYPQLKSQVSKNTEITTIAGKILCQYAIRDKLEEAKDICSGFIK